MRESDADTGSIHDDLIDALFATPVPIAVGAATVTLVMAGSGILSGHDIVFYLLAGLMAAVGVLRFWSHQMYQRSKLSQGATVGASGFERLAMLGAWSTAALITAYGTYTIEYYQNHPIAILAVAQTIGYLAGISGRNTSRPLVTKVQVLIAAVPFTVALMVSGEPTYLLIALSVLLTTLLTFSSAQIMFEVFVSRQRTMRDLERMANLDTLTSLYNRRGFLRQLDAIAASGAGFTLVSVDIDNFKTVNDSFGHDVGDTMLLSLSEAISGLLEKGDTAARMGGDEFMIVTSRSEDSAADLAARLIAHVRGQRYIAGRSVATTLSIGIAAVDAGTTVEEALKKVDIALYKAKFYGRNRYVAYTPALSIEHDERLAFESEMREGIRNGEFWLAYQPVYNPRSGTVTHVEALLRWTHPTRGVINPAVFIPIAERTGLIRVLGAWALETAVRTALTLPDKIRMSVNVSAHQFEPDHDLVAIVAAVLKTSGLEPRRLVIEITESTLINDSAIAIESLKRLRQMGVCVALDDFGTGYSSLSYLTWLPIDILKIDKSFCDNIETSSRSHALMKAITQLAHDLDLLIIVEGIENETQLAAIREFSIHGIQGYVFAKPMTDHALREIIDKRVPSSRTAMAPGNDDLGTKAVQKTPNVA